MTLQEIVKVAQDQLQLLIGRPADSVIGVAKDNGGWRLTIEVVEVERVPASTNILGSYEVRLDSDGNVTGYERTGRYHRNQAGDDESL